MAAEQLALRPQALEAFYSSGQHTVAQGLLVVGSDPDPVPQPLLCSSWRPVVLRQVVAGCGVLREVHRVVTSQAISRDEW